MNTDTTEVRTESLSLSLSHYIGIIMETLGRLEKLPDLRTIWPLEAVNFTKWLARDENLLLLSEAVGLDIMLMETESCVGNFNVDIFAREERTGKNIVIENQLEETDHDHLGKLLTYASGKDASYIIWIVRKARDEHRNAVEWLNRHTDEDVNFFLLEIEVWRINDSLPAPKFNIVSMPNNWAKEIRLMDGSLSEVKDRQLTFWSEFREYAITNFPGRFTLRKPLPRHYYDISLGPGNANITLSLNTRKNTANAMIYISGDKALYDRFHRNQDNVEQILGQTVTWHESKKDSKFFTSREANVMVNNEDWEECFSWMCEQIVKLREIYGRFSVDEREQDA